MTPPNAKERLRALRAEKEALWDEGKNPDGFVMLSADESSRYRSLKDQIEDLERQLLTPTPCICIDGPLAPATLRLDGRFDLSGEIKISVQDSSGGPIVEHMHIVDPDSSGANPVRLRYTRTLEHFLGATRERKYT
jgi:hypothetical protein